MAEIDFSNQRALLIEDMAEARILQKKCLAILVLSILKWR